MLYLSSTQILIIKYAIGFGRYRDLCDRLLPSLRAATCVNVGRACREMRRNFGLVLRPAILVLPSWGIPLCPPAVRLPVLNLRGRRAPLCHQRFQLAVPRPALVLDVTYVLWEWDHSGLRERSAFPPRPRHSGPGAVRPAVTSGGPAARRALARALAAAWCVARRQGRPVGWPSPPPGDRRPDGSQGRPSSARSRRLKSLI